jgi:hypothetical protein
VARRQLRALGLSFDAIDRSVQAGHLHVLHRGVYAVGHRALTRHGHWMAAVLAGGHDAALSHRSAAALWGILATARRDIEITVARECEALRLGSPASLQALLARYARRPGTPAIRRLLDEGRIHPTATRSELERRFLSLLEAENLSGRSSMSRSCSHRTRMPNRTSDGRSIGSSSSSTATRPMEPGRPSSATVLSRSKAGAYCTSPGANSATTDRPSQRNCARCSTPPRPARGNDRPMRDTTGIDRGMRGRSRSRRLERSAIQGPTSSAAPARSSGSRSARPAGRPRRSAWCRSCSPRPCRRGPRRRRCACRRATAPRPW